MIDASLAWEFGLETENVVSEEELVAALEARIQVLMQREPMRLLQILYRMDVDERAADTAIASANPADLFARLILQRARTNTATRNAFRPPSPPADGDADLIL